MDSKITKNQNINNIIVKRGETFYGRHTALTPTEVRTNKEWPLRAINTLVKLKTAEVFSFLG